jgi:hypothetical protein
MGKVGMIVLLVFAGVSAAIISVWLVTRARAVPLTLDIDLPTAYRPGEAMPPDAYCDWHYYDYQYMSCHTRGSNGGWTSFIYDVRLRAISYTSRAVADDLTIGNLAIAWGTPIGADLSGWSKTIYWEHHSAYVWGSEFSPNSRVLYISYWLRAEARPTWRGFVSDREIGA